MTDQEYTREAERHLAAFMEAQRQQRVASDLMAAAFRDGEIGSDVDTGLISGTEAEADYEDAKEAAQQYAQARNSGARIRSYNEDNESQRQGVASALAWLDRKRKSAIKK
jgi:hypothetical protein